MSTVSPATLPRKIPSPRAAWCGKFCWPATALLAGDSLETFPRRGRIGRVVGTRELVALHPYVLVYQVTSSGEVTIVNVWHGAQDRP
jgi:hypothetical protein